MLLARLIFVSPISSSDALPDAEGQEDYEEESFDYSERENLASNKAQDLAKLNKISYYNYTKVASRYNTS